MTGKAHQAGETRPGCSAPSWRAPRCWSVTGRTSAAGILLVEGQRIGVTPVCSSVTRQRSPGGRDPAGVQRLELARAAVLVGDRRTTAAGMLLVDDREDRRDGILLPGDREDHCDAGCSSVTRQRSPGGRDPAGKQRLELARAAVLVEGREDQRRRRIGMRRRAFPVIVNVFFKKFPKKAPNCPTVQLPAIRAERVLLVWRPDLASTPAAGCAY